MLLNRGYRPKVVDAAIVKARALDRNEALKKVEKSQEENDRVRFITTYEARLPNISRILKENHKVMLESDGRLKGAFPKPPMVCFKRPPNFKDILCRAKLPPKRTHNMGVQKPGYRRCNKPFCRMCPYTRLQPGQVRDSISFAHSGEKIQIKSPIDCQTYNVLYELHCLKDSKPYLGKTSKTAEARFVGHLGTILQDCHSNTNTPVGQHFRSAGHSHTDIQVTPFEKVKSRNPFVRKAREAYLRDKHQLLINGLNKKL